MRGGWIAYSIAVKKGLLIAALLLVGTIHAQEDDVLPAVYPQDLAITPARLEALAAWAAQSRANLLAYGREDRRFALVLVNPGPNAWIDVYFEIQLEGSALEPAQDLDATIAARVKAELSALNQGAAQLRVQFSPLVTLRTHGPARTILGAKRHLAKSPKPLTFFLARSHSPCLGVDSDGNRTLSQADFRAATVEYNLDACDHSFSHELFHLLFFFAEAYATADSAVTARQAAELEFMVMGDTRRAPHPLEIYVGLRLQGAKVPGWYEYARPPLRYSIADGIVRIHSAPDESWRLTYIRFQTSPRASIHRVAAIAYDDADRRLTSHEAQAAYDADGALESVPMIDITGATPGAAYLLIEATVSDAQGHRLKSSILRVNLPATAKH